MQLQRSKADDLEGREQTRNILQVLCYVIQHTNALLWAFILCMQEFYGLISLLCLLLARKNSSSPFPNHSRSRTSLLCAGA